MNKRRWSVSTVGTVILCLWAFTVLAGDIKMLPDRPFESWISDASGVKRDVYAPGGEIMANVRFFLGLSDSGNYPITITLEVGQGAAKETIEAYTGALGEGAFLLQQKVRLSGKWSGAVPYKVVMRVRMFKRSPSGESESWYAYLKSEGTFTIGYK